MSETAVYGVVSGQATLGSAQQSLDLPGCFDPLTIESVRALRRFESDAAMYKAERQRRES